MRKLLLPLVFAALPAALAVPSAAQTVTFTEPDNAPAGITMQVLEGNDDVAPTTLAKTGKSWVYTVTPNHAAWRNNYVFLINLPERKSTSDAYEVSSDAVTLELDFSFTPTDVENIDVPIELFRSIGYKERLRIEGLPRFQRFQKILLSQALARHYFNRLQNRHDGITQYTARLWFESLYAAIVTDGRPLLMGEDVSEFLNNVFDAGSDDARHFAGARAQVRQSTWLQQAELPALLSTENCDGAAALVSELEAFDAKNPDDAEVMGIADADAVLAALRGRVDEACPAP